MSIITQGMKSAKLVSQGYSSATYTRIYYDVLRVDFVRDIVQTTIARDVVRTNMERDIIQVPDGG